MPKVSGKAAMFTFDELIGKPTERGRLYRADEELRRLYRHQCPRHDPSVARPGEAFHHLYRRAVRVPSQAVLTTAVPLTQLFLSKDELKQAAEKGKEDAGRVRLRTRPQSTTRCAT